jgi:DNA-binding MurR/RpiR family transcriptional regulator
MAAQTPLLRRLQDDAEGFSKNQRVLARYVLSNYQSVAFATVAKLAGESGVSQATIVRFAKALDFDGHPDFQQEIQRLLHADLRGIERFKRGIAKRSPARTPLDLIADKERDNIAALHDAHDQPSFRKALAMLRAAPEVVVVGTRSTAPLAYHLAFALDKIAIKTTRVTTISSDVYEHLARIDRRACVIVIGFPRYLREQVALLEFAKARGLATLTVTDSAFSPLQGRVSLYAPAESASFVAFHCAPLVLLNALVHRLSIADEKKTLAALDRFEEFAESQHYFTKE